MSDTKSKNPSDPPDRRETRLTEAQRRLLTALSNGDHITYSQDGECGWLYPSRINLDDLGISDDELQQLRADRFIAAECRDDDEGYRFGPPDAITPAGRSALAQSEDARKKGE